MGPRFVSRRAFLKGAAAGAGVLTLARTGSVAVARSDGPSATAPYVIPTVPGVKTTAILTVGEAAPNGYRLVGVPDGLGALAGERTFTVFMNHELRATAGGVRAHGSTGAFVSRWTIDRKTMRVISGADNTRSAADIRLWDPATRRYVAGGTTWDRFCSADLPARSALRHGNRGTESRIHFNGEEVTGGRAFAHVVSGQNAGESWQLPRLGRLSLENVVASPHAEDKTIIVCLEDASLLTAPVVANNPSEVYVYVGEKRASGNAIERAGLTNGKLCGIRVRKDGAVITEESNAFGFGNATTGFVGRATFELVELGPDGDVSNLTAAELQTDAIAKNVFRFQRPEDGAWDPRRERDRDFFFVTTASPELHAPMASPVP